MSEHPRVHEIHPDIVKRLKRADGHLKSIIEMIESGRPCLDVAQQLHAVEKAVAQANDIRRKFADRNVTTWQIVLFGLTGGLIPCPAAITLVTVGAAAALSIRHATKRWSWFSAAARKAPYFSSILIIAVGLYVGYHGWAGLEAQAAVGATAPAGG